MEIRESYETRRREEEYRAALEKSVHYFSGNSYITELRKMGYDQAKQQQKQKHFLTQRLQKNSVQKIVFLNAKM